VFLLARRAGLVGLVGLWSGLGCGSRTVSGDQTDAIAVTQDDAGPNQRGPLDAVAPDLPANPGMGDAARPVDTDAREVGETDAGATPDVPVRACTAPARRCDGKSPQSCDANGAWQSNGTACPYACAAGDCTGVCVPGAYQCTASTRQLCTAAGQWADNLACPFVCAGTSCGGVCVPGRSQCLAGDLETCTPAGIWQSVGTASRELLVNGGFDSGEPPWTNPGIRIVYLGNGSNPPRVVAQSPLNLAWFGGLNREDDQLTQDVTIPANAASVTLSFYYTIISDEVSAAENDVLDVSALVGTQVVPLGHLGDNNQTNDWIRFTSAVPLSLAGQTVTLQIRAITNATLVSSFYIDTVSLQAVACP
jgi:hypothetical protein